VLKYCHPSEVPTGETKHTYIKIPKNDNTGFGVLSPFSPCPGLTVPGTGKSRVEVTTVWSGFNYCKKSRKGGYTEKVFANPAKTYGGVGIKILRNKDGVVTGLDRSKEEFLFNGRTINFVQARWAILQFLYEQYLDKYCSGPVRDLISVVNKVEPYDVFLYDYANTSADYFDPTSPLSYAYLLVNTINLRYMETEEAQGVETDDEPTPPTAA